MAPVQKKRTYRSLKFTSPKMKDSHMRELLLTVGNGVVLKAETIEKSGRRRQVTEADLAELVGERRTDLGAALEHAYALGFADALEHEEDEDWEDTAQRHAAGLKRLRGATRKVILGRALRRRHTQRQKRSKRGGVRAMG